ncbi:MAG TPA: sigma factor-like helix-turn-helix DNA-binding protein [Steroidobacteraceae bacterium]|nr:sigma factor-like helix-turn-helix DNA-binding protein [Steroidobacteraceae bacterium]
MLDPVTEVRNSLPVGATHHGPPDLLLIERARSADQRAVEALLRRYAQRLFRVARSVLGDDDAAHSAVLEACVAAFDELRRHEPAGKFAAWLTRFALEQVHARRAAVRSTPRPAPVYRHPLEPAIDALPEVFRTVFVLRVVEGISGTETAAALGLNVTTVRTRLYRAHRRLSGGAALQASQGVFELDGARTERIVAEVLTRLRVHAA